MSATAHIVHRAPGRLRLRIPARRRDTGYFGELAERLARLPGVESVRADSLSAGVLILHRGVGEAELAAACEGLAELSEVPPPARRAIDQAAAALERADAALRQASGGRSDTASLVFLLLAALALVQLGRGQVLAPASSLLWHALELVRHPGGRD